MPMPSWKIENAATAAAVAFPLLDVAGIVGEGQLVIRKKALSIVCCILWNICRRRGVSSVTAIVFGSGEVQGLRTPSLTTLPDKHTHVTSRAGQSDVEHFIDSYRYARTSRLCTPIALAGLHCAA